MHPNACATGTPESFVEEEPQTTLVIRRGLNYALWSLQNYEKAKHSFIEKAIKVVFEMVREVRNTPGEMSALFVYWLLHEIVFDAEHIDATRVHAGIAHLERLAQINAIPLSVPTEVYV